MSRISAIAAAILTTAMAASAITVNGFVRDQDGNSIEGALVTFASEEDPALVASGLTGSDGSYEVDLAAAPATAILGVLEQPDASALFQNYPNPFNPETIIAFQLEQPTDVQLVIYNSLGQTVRTLVHTSMDAGLHRVRWNAADDAGHGVAAGTYFYQLTTDNLVDTGKMTLVDGHKGSVSSENGRLSPLMKPSAPAAASKVLAESNFFSISVSGTGFFDYTRSGLAINEDQSVDMLVNSSTDLGMVRLALTDAPIDEADAVLITINTVDIRRAGGGPWQTFVGESRTFDLLSLTGGVNEMLGEQVLEPGEFTGVRLIVEAAQIVIDGETFDLEVPSGEQRGIQLQGSFNIVTGETLELMMDFDARKSITRRGQGNNFALKPVVRLVPTTGAGFIEGRVFAEAGEEGIQAVVIATQNGEEISSAIVDPEEGTYRISYLEPGLYDLRIETELGVDPQVIEGVEVTARRGTRRVDFGERLEDDDDGEGIDDGGNGTDDDGAGTDDDGGGTDDDGEGTDDDGEGTDDDGEGTDDDGEGTDDDGEGTDDDGEGTDDDGEGTDDDGAGTDDDGEGTDDDGAGTDDDGEGTDDDGAGTDDDGAGTDDDGAGTDDDGAGTDDGTDAEVGLSLDNAEEAWGIALQLLTRVVTEAAESGASSVAGDVEGDATVTTSVDLSGITYVIVFAGMSDDGEAAVTGEVTINTTDGEQFDYDGELDFDGALVGELTVDMSGTTDGTSGTLMVGDEELVIE